jgi:hypothetical protein
LPQHFRQLGILRECAEKVLHSAGRLFGTPEGIGTAGQQGLQREPRIHLDHSHPFLEFSPSGCPSARKPEAPMKRPS